MSANASIFDPYAVWLQIHEPQRPLNAYQLLGLKLLENERTRIQTAVLRQRSLMEARQEDTDPQMWQQVNDELEEAIATLLDSSRKQLLDAALKRQLNGKVASYSGPAHTGTEPIKCRGCQKENPPQRKYCGDCGAALYDRCPKCSAEVVASERFCGHCGTNLQESSRAQEADLEERLRKAQELHKSHRFDDAAALLRSVAVVEDARFDRQAREALRLTAEFAEQRHTLAKDVDELLAKARQYQARHSYERAFEKLDSIPEPLRSLEVNDLLSSLRAKKLELHQLSGEIRESLAQNRSHDLLPKIERLLLLKPDHEQAKEIAGQLRDKICSAARKKVAEHCYDEARSMVESLPGFVRNEEVEQLLDGILEADSLSTTLRLSPVADDSLVLLARRLVKVAPKDESAAKQLAAIQARRATKPTDPHAAFPAWSAPPRRTLLGLPVDRLGPFTRCDFASPELEKKLREQPGQFFVALGLALQAREQAAVAINLLPEKEGGGFLKGFSLSLSFRKSQPKGGWGLDLGRTGLRAIRLGPETKDGRVRIESVVHIPHAKPLGQGGEEVFDVDLLTTTLRTFREQHPLPKEKEKRDLLVAALPGGRTLGRFFDLPPVDAKKLPELVQYEAKHQVPFSLDELMWDYQVVDEAAIKPDESARHVVLLAAKDFHVNERLTAFKNAEIDLDAMTADPLALHNAIVYEFLSGDSPARHVAVMDVGTQGSSFVVSSPKSVWFRTSSNGADEFTAALVKQLQLTTTTADEIKRAPHRARRFHQWQSALQPLFVKQASEIERSLATFARQFPNGTVELLYLAGGGAATQGLLGYLVHGR